MRNICTQEPSLELTCPRSLSRKHICLCLCAFRGTDDEGTMTNEDDEDDFGLLPENPIGAE